MPESNPISDGDDPTLRQVLDAAADLPAEQRPAFLERACGGDAALRKRVEALLRALDLAGEFLANPTAEGGGETVSSAGAREEPGGRVGPYKLLQKIGEGGMGVVYMAEQQRPVVRRVALKVIKLGMDTRQVIARFEAERQALALMDHPNIAKVLDAGATEEGRPYFVMELVKGVSITDYCDTNNLPTRQRLELFLPVCRAVQHAHQKGVIHRDLKPSNVLVTMHDGVPVPKVIDFGVAKATAGRLTDKTLFTEYHQFVGTPEYMSPEQAEMSGLDIDTRADVYALGVLLYELLTGSTPFDGKTLRRAAYAEIQRIIREVEPPKPSTRISTLGETLTAVAARRSADPRKLSALMRGDLDWIVMRCLEKDRARRYETANAVAMDVGRYLKDEPVEASPPSAVYRLRKVARRNKAVVGIAGLVLIFVGLAGGGIGWDIRNRAGRQFVLEQQVAMALDEAEKAARRDDLIEASSAVKRAGSLLASGGSNASLHERVGRWQTDLDVVRRLEDAAMAEAQYAYSRARVIPAYEAAFREYGIEADVTRVDEAVRRLRARSPALQIPLIAGLDQWRNLVGTRGKRSDLYGRKLTWLTVVVGAVDRDPWRQRVRGLSYRDENTNVLAALASSPDLARQDPSTMVSLASGCDQLGRRDLAIGVLRRAQVRYPGDFWINVNLGWMLHESDPRDGDALTFSRIAVALRPHAAGARLFLSDVLKAEGKLDQAVAECRRGIELNPNEASAHNDMALLLDAQGKLDEAISQFHTAVSMQPENDEIHLNLGRFLTIHNRLGEAESEFHRAIELNPELAEAYVDLGNIFQQQGKHREALAEHRKAMKLEPRLVQAHVGLAADLLNLGELSEAMEELRLAIQLKPDDADAHRMLGMAFQRQGKLIEAVAECRKAVALKPDIAELHRSLGTVLLDQKKLTEAIVEFRKALSLAPDSAEAHSGLGLALHHDGQGEQAMVELKKAIELDPRLHEPHHERARMLFEQGKLNEAVAEYRVAIETRPTEAEAHADLGTALAKQGNLDEAVREYQQAIDLKPVNLADLHNNLGTVLKDQGKLEQAVAAFRKSIELKPDSAAPHINLGACLRDQQKLAEASREYERAARLLPDSGELRLAVEQLHSEAAKVPGVQEQEGSERR